MLLVALFAMVATAFADEAEDKAEFMKLYAEFNELYANSEELEQIIKVAENIYKLSESTYGKFSQQRAVTAYNLATLHQEVWEKSGNKISANYGLSLYEIYFDILRRKKASIDREYLNQYLKYFNFDLAFHTKYPLNYNFFTRNRASVKKLRRITKSLKLSKLELAGIEHIIGLRLFIDPYFPGSVRAFEKSANLYAEELGENHITVAENIFWMGKNEFARNKYKKAEDLFSKALEVFKNDKDKGPSLEASTRSFLIAIYEETDRQDEATIHCVALSEERGDDFDRFVKPLYKKSPKFPSSRRSANVLLEFDVDENGFVKNIKILESSNDGFNQASIEALSRSRFAPTIKNGERIVTTGLKQAYNYRVVMRR